MTDENYFRRRRRYILIAWLAALAIFAVAMWVSAFRPLLYTLRLPITLVRQRLESRPPPG